MTTIPKPRTRSLPSSMARSPLNTSPGVRTPGIQRSMDVSHSHPVTFFYNCRLSKYIEIHPPPSYSPTVPTHPRPSHTHPTGSATSPDHIRPPAVSPTVPRPTEDIPHAGLEREFVSSVSSDFSDLYSAERSPRSDHPPWVLAGDGRGAAHFPPSTPGHAHPYNNMTSSGRPCKSCTRFCTLQTGLTDTTSDK